VLEPRVLGVPGRWIPVQEMYFVFQKPNFVVSLLQLISLWIPRVRTQGNG
jgi:hypothetical protein